MSIRCVQRKNQLDAGIRGISRLLRNKFYSSNEVNHLKSSQITSQKKHKKESFDFNEVVAIVSQGRRRGKASGSAESEWNLCGQG